MRCIQIGIISKGIISKEPQVGSVVRASIDVIVKGNLPIDTFMKGKVVIIVDMAEFLKRLDVYTPNAIGITYA